MVITLFPSERKVLKEDRCPLVSDMYVENILKCKSLQKFALITFSSSFGGR